MNGSRGLTYWASALAIGVLAAAVPAEAASENDSSADATEVTRPAFRPLRFTEDWSAYGDILRDQRRWPDQVKYLPLSDDESVRLSIGGSARARLEHWRNFNFGDPPDARNNDTFVLGRAFLHADLQAGEHLRVFGELKSAGVTDRRLIGGRRAIDVDTFDVQNLFVDVSTPIGSDDGTLTFRAGRQELLFGGQRLVSPLDWANTRRTFEGFSAILDVGDWSVHGFYTQPVEVRKYDWNRRDSDSQFFGVFGTGQLEPLNATLDMYWLGLHRQGPVTFNETTGRERRQTVGTRLAGEIGDTAFDYDVEGAYQFGKVGNDSISAYMFASRTGYTFSEVWSTPRVFAGFDYASGDRSPGGRVQTFNQLFPLGHAYLGWIDAVGRQNIIAASTGVTFDPVDRLTVDVHGHMFWRAETTDALYNVGGAVSRAGDAGSSREVGAELDLLLRYQLDRHNTVSFGYSHFFPGRFIRESGPSDSMQFLYTGWEYRF